MKARRFFFVLLCLTTSCLGAPHSRPAKLDKLAAQFKAKAGSERIAEGKEIVYLMPACHVSHGRWWLLGFDESGGIEDVDHPSYLLLKADFFQRFGLPDRRDNPASPWNGM